MKTAVVQIRLSPKEKKAFNEARSLDHSENLSEFFRRAANDRLRILMGKAPLPIDNPWKEFMEMLAKAPQVQAGKETLRIIDDAQQRMKMGTYEVLNTEEALRQAKKLESN